MADRVLSLASLPTAEEALRELPMPAVLYFAITFVLFLIALGVTWMFRNTAYKVRPPGPRPEGALGHSGPSDGSHH